MQSINHGRELELVFAVSTSPAHIRDMSSLYYSVVESLAVFPNYTQQ